MGDAKLNSALNLMRRMPPSSIENSLAGLLELAPDLTDDLLTHIDQPLKVEKDSKTGKTFVMCDYNRDGDSYRSPWSNLYHPAVADGFLPSSSLRDLEVSANSLFDIYRKMYFDQGSHSSVYFFDTDEDNKDCFGACWLIHKDVPAKGSLLSGWWDSIHVFEVVPGTKADHFIYRLTTTVMIAMVVGDEGTTHKIGQANLSGNMTKQTEEEKKVGKGGGHVQNMGEMLEQMELRIRNGIEGIYIQKTREVINGMRSTTGKRDNEWSRIAESLANTIIKR